MIKKEIIINNKLIADFMSIPELPTQSIERKCYVIDRLCYHSSWDWLMSVVEKIQHLDNEYEVSVDFQIHLMGAVELWIDHKRVFAMTAFECGTLINAVWEAVVEFVKWYNKNKK